MKTKREPTHVFTVSHYTDDNGAHVWSALYNGQPISAARPLESVTRTYAETRYDATKGSKRLEEWNGDTSTQTTIKESL